MRNGSGDIGNAGFFTGREVDLQELYIYQYAVLKKDAIAAEDGFMVGLRSDGTVLAKGDNRYGQCNVESWENIIALSAGDHYTVELKSDGTVVATGENDCGQCDVSEWWDIVAICAVGKHTVGLQCDGRILVTGDNTLNQCDLGKWWDKGIVAISAGQYYTSALTNDGRVLLSGGYYDPAYCFYRMEIGKETWTSAGTLDWRQVVSISAGGWHAVGLCADGSVLAVGESSTDQTWVDDWEDVVQIAVGASYTYTLTQDGRVKSTDRIEEVQWTDIALFEGSDSQVVGLKTDGTVVSLSLQTNRYEEYDLNDWTDIGLAADAVVFEN